MVWYGMRDDDEMSWRWRRSAGPSQVLGRGPGPGPGTFRVFLRGDGMLSLGRSIKCLLPIRDAPGKLKEVN